jgi:cupin 2 domain-containing protein
MNIFKYEIPQTGENFTTLFENKNIKIVRIISSKDIEFKTYLQDEDEWVVLIAGNATILMDNIQHKLDTGDTLFIPSQTPHMVTEVAHGTLWLAVHIF